MNFRSKFAGEKVSPIARPPSGKSKMQQHLVADTDINNILAKYRKTGVLTAVMDARKRFGDFTQIKDVAEAMNVTAQAKAVFERLPSELRDEFKNSIPGFFDYIQDPKNLDRCIELGIYDKPAPTPSPVDPPADPGAGNPAPEG